MSKRKRKKSTRDYLSEIEDAKRFPEVLRVNDTTSDNEKEYDVSGMIIVQNNINIKNGIHESFGDVVIHDELIIPTDFKVQGSISGFKLVVLGNLKVTGTISVDYLVVTGDILESSYVTVWEKLRYNGELQNEGFVKNKIRSWND